MQIATDDKELAAFLDGSMDADAFDHGAHIRMAKKILAGHDFLEAVYLYDQGIRNVTERLGVPEKRSVTKTLAFMALIAETGGRPASNALNAWYSEDRLQQPEARDQFLMPDRTG